MVHCPEQKNERGWNRYNEYADTMEELLEAGTF